MTSSVPLGAGHSGFHDLHDNHGPLALLTRQDICSPWCFVLIQIHRDPKVGAVQITPPSWTDHMMVRFRLSRTVNIWVGGRGETQGMDLLQR